METILLLIFGIILMVVGIILLFRKNIEKFVVWNNGLKGVKTEITERTYIGYKTYAAGAITLGLVSVLWSWL